MLRIAVCDDEEIFVEDTTKQITSILNIENLEFEMSSFYHPKPLLEALARDQNAYDIIFLDILMKEYNGIQIAKAIRSSRNSVAIVFITNSREYSLEGYSVYPFHYLIKPLQNAQLREVILKYCSENQTNPTIIVPTKNGTTILDVKKIIFAEMQDRILRLFTDEGVVESVYSLLKFSEIALEHNIIRCHKGFMVNLKYVSNIKRYQFILKNGTIVPIGRTYYNDAINLLLDFVE